MRTLIIIPAYNEEENIERVVDNLINNFPQYDYVVVNDGSHDDTAVICSKNKYCLIDLPVNLGLAGAFQAGMIYAFENGYDFAVQFDGDGQHRPEYLADLVQLAVNLNKDIVIGSRFVNERRPKNARMLGSVLISSAIKLTTGVRINDPTSGMRLYNKGSIKEFAQHINYGPEPDTLAFLLAHKIKCGEVQVQMDERIAGESYLNIKNSIIYMIKMLLSILLIQWFRVRSVN